MRVWAALLFLGGLLAGCDGGGPVVASDARAAPAALPVMRWDHRPEGKEWTRATIAALEKQGANLVSVVPSDVATWCPSYAEAPRKERRAFWSGLLSALAKYESTWRPDAVGGGGRWFGLVQIAPATADNYGCAADSGAELKNGEANLACAVRIMAHTVPRDGVVAAKGGGVAADWGPFASAAKRTEMAAWTRARSYCR